MSSHNDMPDILGEILGGPRESHTTPPMPDHVVEWEYREVVFRDYRGWRARVVNGVELGDWKTAPTIVEYLERVGREGWELVSMSDRHNNHKEAYFKRRAIGSR
jgi:hypothetical protein